MRIALLFLCAAVARCRWVDDERTWVDVPHTRDDERDWQTSHLQSHVHQILSTSTLTYAQALSAVFTLHQHEPRPIRLPDGKRYHLRGSTTAGTRVTH